MSGSPPYAPPGPIWAWVCPLTGEGLVAAMVPGIGTTPMVSLDENLARGRMATWARAVAQATGRPVQLVRWHVPEVLEVIDVR